MRIKERIFKYEKSVTALALKSNLQISIGLIIKLFEIINCLHYLKTKNFV